MHEWGDWNHARDSCPGNCQVWAIRACSRFFLGWVPKIGRRESCGERVYCDELWLLSVLKSRDKVTLSNNLFEIGESDSIRDRVSVRVCRNFVPLASTAHFISWIANIHSLSTDESGNPMVRMKEVVKLFHTLCVCGGLPALISNEDPAHGLGNDHELGARRWMI